MKGKGKKVRARARPRCRGALASSRRGGKGSGEGEGEGGSDDVAELEWESLSSGHDGGESLSSSSSEISWGPDSPLTAALWRHRAALTAPQSPPSPVSSGSTGLTRAEEELRELEEQVKNEVARRGVLVRRLLASRKREDYGRRWRRRK